MSAIQRPRLISIEDYLAGEASSPVKHEYLSGVVYAMAGGRNAHNIIKGNVFASFHARLHGKPCRPFDSDTKIRIRLASGVRFYYPDDSVVCRPNPQTDSFQDEPVVLVEVLSRGTRRIDEGEKKDAYQSIPSLTAYILIEQETAAATVFRRTAQGFRLELHQGLDAIVPLPEIGIELPLRDVYDGIEFAPEADEPG